MSNLKLLKFYVILLLFQIFLFCFVFYINKLKLNLNSNNDINSIKFSRQNDGNKVPLNLQNDDMGNINHWLLRLNLISQEFWNYVINYSNSLKKTRFHENITNTLVYNVENMKNVFQIEIASLSAQLGIDSWTQSVGAELSAQVQRRISDLQNPPKQQCISEQTIICNHTNGHGFSSGFHDIVWCLIAAYYSNRTVILLSSHYHYLKEGTHKWHDFFVPLSSSCDESVLKNLSRITKWPGDNNPISRRLLHYIPKSIGTKLVSFHSNPMSWWFGQFVGYIMRPTNKMAKLLDIARSDLNFSKPIVGIHIRRTDKIGSEGAYHDISEYMVHVDDYYSKLDLIEPINTRKVYLATDDSNVWHEIVKKYPNYKFIGNQTAAYLASKMDTRYSTDSFLQLIIDIYLLAETDYIVCTFSSGVCRIAYELMQTYYTDGGQRAQSIDVPFHYAWILNPPRVAIYNHKPVSNDEWSLSIGDELYVRDGEDYNGQAINGKKWDTYFYGTDLRKTKYMKYPAYKTVQNIPLYYD